MLVYLSRPSMSDVSSCCIELLMIATLSCPALRHLIHSNQHWASACICIQRSNSIPINHLSHSRPALLSCYPCLSMIDQLFPSTRNAKQSYGSYSQPQHIHVDQQERTGCRSNYPGDSDLMRILRGRVRGWINREVSKLPVCIRKCRRIIGNVIRASWRTIL